MKNTILLISFLAGFCACQTEPSKGTPEVEVEEEVKPLVPGTVLLADSMRVPDALNERYFSVKLVANEYTRQGTYDVQIRYGENDAVTQITFPRGGTEKIIPVLKKGKEPYSYIIGFRYGNKDPLFYEYYWVQATKDKIETKYVKAYSFK
ncbi:MAG TPA: hypothetical protein VL098_02755 [Flavipsychrobacter sp.]|nr:hypothetical protein [Flavipsychrobacter sp.]